MQAIAARSVEERLAEWEAFNREMSRVEESAPRRRHPDYDDDMVLRALVRSRYGDRLAQAVWPGEPLLDP